MNACLKRAARIIICLSTRIRAQTKSNQSETGVANATISARGWLGFHLLHIKREKSKVAGLWFCRNPTSPCTVRCYFRRLVRRRGPRRNIFGTAVPLPLSQVWKLGHGVTEDGAEQRTWLCCVSCHGDIPDTQGGNVSWSHISSQAKKKGGWGRKRRKVWKGKKKKKKAKR